MALRWDRARCNATRYDPDSDRGHYESWFQRANHPTKPLAFWIRYTIFAPRHRPQDAVGELWAVVFDRDEGTIHAAKRDVAMAKCRFADAGLDVKIGEATLDDGRLCGAVDELSWDLQYQGDQAPSLLLPDRLYTLPFPKAKALVGQPMVRYTGSLEIGDRTIEVDDWLGSQNHNWGSQHTDRYAWGQVAGFDEHPEVFVECASARVRIGPLWTPWTTLVVVRGVDPQPIEIRRLTTAMRVDVTLDVDGRQWNFEGNAGDTRIVGRFWARPEDFVALRYRNPPGGAKTCLNSKVASCELLIERGGKQTILRTEHRAAFEILVDPDQAPAATVG